jgi:hypothetical protein
VRLGKTKVLAMGKVEVVDEVLVTEVVDKDAMNTSSDRRSYPISFDTIKDFENKCLLY